VLPRRHLPPLGKSQAKATLDLRLPAPHRTERTRSRGDREIATAIVDLARHPGIARAALTILRTELLEIKEQIADTAPGRAGGARIRAGVET